MQENDPAALNRTVNSRSSPPLASKRTAVVATTKAPAAEASSHSNRASTSGRKDDAIQRRDWINYAAVLSQKQHALELSAKLPKDALREAQQLEVQISEASGERRKLAATLHANINKVHALVAGVKAKLADVQPGQDYIQALAAAMDESEREITTLKEGQRVQFEELAQQERLLTRDLELMMDRMESPAWDVCAQEPAPKRSGQPSSNGRLQARQGGGGGLLPEVLAMDDFMDRHGEFGGWQAEDNAEFERILAACRGDYSHATLVAYDEMVGFSKADIIAHARWHAEYTDLAVSKRIAIAEWRCRRDAERAALAAQASVGPASAQQAQAEREESEQEQRLQREYQKQALSEWKAAKQEEERAALEGRRRVREEAQQAKEAERAAKQAANKAQLEDYRKQKMAEQRRAEQAAAEAAAAKVTPVAPEALQRLQERNEALMRRREELATAKAREQAEKAERLEKLRQEVAGQIEARVKPDPQRLLRPTSAQQIRKVAAEEGGHAPRQSGFIRNVQHRAVPSWRKGL
ncbi:hypothetical protein WJX72_003050 [[Myrmecia] bisecta]|uniref:Uncharacterized protein n=1 Tax=[Myrmecia] bisecta TaxID=41462 RepID=A0AAW1PWU8_9CHLO